MTKDLIELTRESRYPLDAFLFVQRGLDHTVRKTHGEEPRTDEQGQPVSRHVSGQQLCMGLRDFAIEQYGLLARPVLRRWGVTRCEDFGRIVFAMVQAGMMQKTDEDTLDDFANVFDFAEAFPTAMELSDTKG